MGTSRTVRPPRRAGHDRCALRRTDRAIDRYDTAFKDGELSGMQCAERVADLELQRGQLRAPSGRVCHPLELTTPAAVLLAELCSHRPWTSGPAPRQLPRDCSRRWCQASGSSTGLRSTPCSASFASPPAANGWTGHQRRPTVFAPYPVPPTPSHVDPPARLRRQVVAAPDPPWSGPPRWTRRGRTLGGPAPPFRWSAGAASASGPLAELDPVPVGIQCREADTEGVGLRFGLHERDAT